MAAEALGDAVREALGGLDDRCGIQERYADALDAQGQLREELRMEQEERLALEEELQNARARYDELAADLAKVKERNSDLDIRENERSTGACVGVWREGLG